MWIAHRERKRSGRAEAHGSNLSPLNGIEQINHLIAQLQEQAGKRDKGGACIRKTNAATTRPAKEADAGDFLELSGLDGKIWLRCMKLVRGRAETLLFENRKRVAEMPKLSPIVHTPNPVRKTKVIGDRFLSTALSYHERDRETVDLQ